MKLNSTRPYRPCSLAWIELSPPEAQTRVRIPAGALKNKGLLLENNISYHSKKAHKTKKCRISIDSKSLMDSKCSN